ITEPSVFAASLGSVTHVSCNGGNDGSASVVPFGGTTPYSYSWSTAPVQTDSIATGLSAGTDTVVISDFNGCNDTVIATLNEPPLLTAGITDSVNVSCFGGSNGQATVMAGGGAGLYAYLWNDPDTQTTQTATGLLAGSYNVIITDDDSCSTTVNVTLTEPSPLVANVTGSVNVSCNSGNDGLMVVAPSGGTPPYYYLWDDDSIQTADSAIALNAGIYTVIVTDTMGCDTSATDTITEPALLLAAISSVTNVNCKGDSTGSATVNVSGGTQPYTYLWNDANAQTDTIATALPADTFLLIVTDFMGCDTAISATVTEPDSLILSFTNIANVACYSDSTGEATAGVSGGTLPYTYLWNVPDTASQTNSTVTGLSVGIYDVTVTDALGCADNDSVNITESPEILITVSNDTLICAGDNALISAFASGGAGALTYTWSDPLLSGTGPFSVSPADSTSYTVTVTDSLGCNSKDSMKVQVGPVIIIFAVDDSICVGDSTTISAFVMGGDGNYSYLWQTGETTNAITVYPTISTYYTLTVDDGCATPPVTDSVLVEVNPYPVLSLLPADAYACASANIGFIDLIADILGSTYYWDFGDGNTDTTSNPAVNYTYNNTGIFDVSVSVISPQGCQTDSANFGTVVISPAPTADFTGGQ
ncbi:MAG: PKD domain-containing protein, partial [Flavobacteriales bacterium]|nr:PKD domain-containing protein [Flavobacteriales bacterium]